MSSGRFLSSSKVDYISTKASYYNDMATDSLTKDVGRVAGEVMELFIESVAARVVVTPVAWSPGQFLSLTQKVTSVQSPALRSLVWLPAALYYSLLLSILASGGDSRLVPTLTPIPDHSNNSTPTWLVSWLSSISFSKQSNSFSLAVTPPNPRKIL